LKNLEHMEMHAQYKILFWPLPSFNKRSWSLIIPPRITTYLHTDRQIDTRSRSRQYIDRAKDWVEWTLEKPLRVKNSVLPRCARQQLMSHREFVGSNSCWRPFFGTNRLDDLEIFYNPSHI
jgi:hypothetical protein